MNSVNCKHPTVIFNPYLIYYLCQLHCTIFLDGISISRSDCWHKNALPWTQLYAAKKVVTLETCDNYSLVSEDGERYPLFYFVPCGKCELCRSVRVEDWCTRCMAESATSKYRPLFITLTYAPQYRPDNMADCEIDFVLFMKRLRMYVERFTGVKQSLRFIAASEWTPDNHYPHIHMMLWNMPFISHLPGAPNSFWSLIKFIQENCWQKGIARVEPSRDSSGKYCLKYIKKGSLIEENEDEKCWFHSSRRPGIGHEFAVQVLPHVLRNPDSNTIDIPTKDGKVEKRAIPQYFKRIWFPTASLLVPPLISKTLRQYVEDFSNLRYFFMIDGRWPSQLLKISSQYQEIAKKYEFVPIAFSDVSADIQFMAECLAYKGYNDAGSPSLHPVYPLDAVDMPFFDDDGHGYLYKYSDYDMRHHKSLFIFRQSVIELFTRCRSSVAILQSFPLSSDIWDRLKCTDAHKKYVHENMLLNGCEIDIDAKLFAYNQDIDWMKSHWMVNPYT